MATFLLKTDPQTYSLADLRREGSTVWDGIRNAQALAVIRAMVPGDMALIYHSMASPAIVGVAEITSSARPDSADSKGWVVDVRFVRQLEQPITLREIKAAGRFDSWSLIRQSRLSTMTVPDEVVAWLRERGAL